MRGVFLEIHVNPTAKVIAGSGVSRNYDVKGCRYMRIVDEDTHRCHLSVLPIYKEEDVDLMFVMGQTIAREENMVTRNLHLHVVRRTLSREIHDEVGVLRGGVW